MYQTSEESGNNDRKRKDQGNCKTAKRSVRNTRNSFSKKKKGEEEVRSVYNEGYYTDNINSDSLHQESEYQDITDDDNYQKNKKKKPNKKEDRSDKALDDFLETLWEQPVKEMNDTRNKWIMFSKPLERNKKNGMMRSCSRKGRKARSSGRSQSRNTRCRAGKKARRATRWRSKSAKRCRASSHLFARRNMYLQ